MRLSDISDTVTLALRHDRVGDDTFMARLIWRDEEGNVIRVRYAEVSDIFVSSECAIVVDMTTITETRNGQ